MGLWFKETFCDIDGKPYWDLITAATFGLLATICMCLSGFAKFMVAFTP